jgi:CheY-like chemotaxis protein
VVLQPAVAQTLALALHELATNAAKYGALSTPSGKVHIAWEMSPSALSLTWTETGGPPVNVPGTQGFGTRLIGLSIQGQLNGNVSFDWRPEGLSCEITIAREIPTLPGMPVEAEQNPEQPRAAIDTSRRRLMVVEDEALVAMMMVGFVEELGFRSCGPFANIKEAAAAVRNGSCDGAVLDVNLGGELVYPVADLLTDLGVPFVFVTGYSSDLVDERFNDVPILQKPVQVCDLEQALTSLGLPTVVNRQTQRAAI